VKAESSVALEFGRENINSMKKNIQAPLEGEVIREDLQIRGGRRRLGKKRKRAASEDGSCNQEWLIVYMNLRAGGERNPKDGKSEGDREAGQVRYKKTRRLDRKGHDELGGGEDRSLKGIPWDKQRGWGDIPIKEKMKVENCGTRNCSYRGQARSGRTVSN